MSGGLLDHFDGSDIRGLWQRPCPHGPASPLSASGDRFVIIFVSRQVLAIRKRVWGFIFRYSWITLNISASC